MRARRARLFAVAGLLYPIVATAQARQLPSARAVRISQAPRIDGRLSEDIWRSAPAITGFTQRDPDEGAPAHDVTEMRFAYDDDALYVGARMFSRDPSAIRALVTKRDVEGSSERACVSFDTYRDRRTAYSFCVTAASVRQEFYHATDNMDDGDEGWNPIWEGTARIDSVGWTAEMRIPFSQLRFSPAAVQEWGMNAVRFSPAQNEEAFWILVRRTETGWSSRMGALTGIEGIQPSRRVEALPYIAADTRTAATYEPQDPFNKQYTNRARVGGDLKMGLGPGMTLDLTVNPDFGQVEGDPAVVNLSAYETFFSERRPFFLEGADLLRQRDLFYSRRIGAQPPGSASGDYVEHLANTTILGAAKLTGQMRPGLQVAALAAVTDRESVRTFDSSATPQSGSTAVAPRTAYAVASVRQLFGRDKSNVSAVLTAVDRDIRASDPFASLLPRSAYSGLAEARWRWAGGEYDFNVFSYFTSVRGDSAAITRLQRNSRRYFQRPDVEHVRLDPSATTLNGGLLSMGPSKLAGKHWLWDLDIQQESPGLEPNDLGRHGAVDTRRASGRLVWRETRPSRWARRWDVSVNDRHEWNFDGMRRSITPSASFNSTFKNFVRFGADVDVAARGLSDRLTRGGPIMGTPRSMGWSMDLNSRDGARNSWSVDVSHSRDENDSWEQSLELNFGFAPSDRFELSFDPQWSRGSDARQYIITRSGGRPETFGSRYIFGRVNLSEVSAEFRMNYTFTPNLSLETYAQPFVASGRFGDFGEMLAPRERELLLYGTGTTTITHNPDGSHTVTDGAASFTISDQDFNERSLRTNMVVRWEWRPGSTMYLVWQQNRAHDRPIADVRPGQLGEAFSGKAENFFAVKVSYWVPVR